MKFRRGNDSYGRKIEKTLPPDLITNEALGDRELVAKKAAEFRDALDRVVRNGETWKMGLVLFWMNEYDRPEEGTCLICSRWDAYWDQIPPACKRQAESEMPPLILRCDSSTSRVTEICSERGIDGEGQGAYAGIDKSALLAERPIDEAIADYANRILKCNRMLTAGASVTKLRVTPAERPSIPRPWYRASGASGDVDFYCKLCGALSFALDHYQRDRDVPDHCPKCGF